MKTTLTHTSLSYWAVWDVKCIQLLQGYGNGVVCNVCI